MPVHGPTLRVKVLDAQPDGDLPEINPYKSGSARLNGSAGSKDSKTLTIINNSIPGPIWRDLDRLSPAEKENARIGFEVSSALPGPVLQEFRNIENLWNGGNHAPAVDRLRDLEESGAAPEIAVGLGWKVPQASSTPLDWGTDVQIGTRTTNRNTYIDFHPNGNIFAVTRRDSGSDTDRWVVNISTDGGSTWSETYAWFASYVVEAVSAAVIDQYLYVGYTGNSTQDDARIRRFFASDGSEDAGYGFLSVFNKAVMIEEIAVTTFADQFGTRIYYYAILADNSLVFYYADQFGGTWTELATGVTNADRGLDACTNEGFVTNYTMASYVDTSNRLHVLLLGGVFTDVELDDATDITSIAAYYDTIITVFEHNLSGENVIKYWISYDGGANWFYAYVSGTTGDFWNPHVAARKGGGISVVYAEEVGEPDICWHRRRPYSGAWETAEQFNTVDVITGTPLSCEWVPPSSGTDGYGAIWLSGSNAAWFDKHELGGGGPPVTIALTPSTTTPKRGTNWSVKATATNTTGVPQSFDFWTNVMLPNGNMFPSVGELFGPRAVSLSAFGSGSGTIPHYIPTSAPLGTFVYYGYVGPYPIDYHMDSFKFDVIP